MVDNKATGFMAGSAAPHADNEDDEEDEEHKVVESDPTGRFERYAESLGKGAYKEVFKAFDEEEGVEVAWNQLRVDHLRKQDAQRILSEIKILQSLRNDNIISLYHAWGGRGADGKERVCFITELMTSGTLKAYLRKTKGPIKPKVLKSWCRQILLGLHYLHTRTPPIIHRDLKCENIFINGNNGQAKIGDLGLAIVKSKDHLSSVLGTPEFMAPEFYDEHYDEKVDIYAFGMVVIEIVTKEYPYSECTNQAQIYKKVSSGIKPAALQKVTDPETREFIDFCIAFDPAKRPSAAELLQSPFLNVASGPGGANDGTAGAPNPASSSSGASNSAGNSSYGSLVGVGSVQGDAQEASASTAAGASGAPQPSPSQGQPVSIPPSPWMSPRPSFASIDGSLGGRDSVTGAGAAWSTAGGGSGGAPSVSGASTAGSVAASNATTLDTGNNNVLPQSLQNALELKQQQVEPAKPASLPPAQRSSVPQTGPSPPPPQNLQQQQPPQPGMNGTPSSLTAPPPSSTAASSATSSPQSLPETNGRLPSQAGSEVSATGTSFYTQPANAGSNASLAGMGGAAGNVAVGAGAVVLDVAERPNESIVIFRMVYTETPGSSKEIRFPFNLPEDTATDVVSEMVKENLVGGKDEQAVRRRLEEKVKGILLLERGSGWAASSNAASGSSAQYGMHPGQGSGGGGGGGGGGGSEWMEPAEQHRRFSDQSAPGGGGAGYDLRGLPPHPSRHHIGSNDGIDGHGVKSATLPRAAQMGGTQSSDMSYGTLPRQHYPSGAASSGHYAMYNPHHHYPAHLQHHNPHHAGGGGGFMGVEKDRSLSVPNGAGGPGDAGSLPRSLSTASLSSMVSSTSSSMGSHLSSYTGTLTTVPNPHSMGYSQGGQVRTDASAQGGGGGNGSPSSLSSSSTATITASSLNASPMGVSQQPPYGYHQQHPQQQQPPQQQQYPPHQQPQAYPQGYNAPPSSSGGSNSGSGVPSLSAASSTRSSPHFRPDVPNVVPDQDAAMRFAVAYPAQATASVQYQIPQQQQQQGFMAPQPMQPPPQQQGVGAAPRSSQLQSAAGAVVLDAGMGGGQPPPLHLPRAWSPPVAEGRIVQQQQQQQQQAAAAAGVGSMELQQPQSQGGASVKASQPPSAASAAVQQKMLELQELSLKNLGGSSGGGGGMMTSNAGAGDRFGQMGRQGSERR
ncbi:hypothetical protein HDU96_003852 [Phlyctochytrium bullatum]|nr:hypothetical protein HDU96_003852 [Phlyctochytrium bullatum]